MTIQRRHRATEEQAQLLDRRDADDQCWHAWMTDHQFDRYLHLLRAGAAPVDADGYDAVAVGARATLSDRARRHRT